MTPSILPLRAHHLLCLTTYQGHGYSPAFVEQMNGLWHALRDGAYSHLRALATADAICGSCPHLQDPTRDTSCRTHASIAERDRRLLDAMGWVEGQVAPLAAALDHVHAHHPELMARVCVGCEWQPLCTTGRFPLREAVPTLPRPGEPTPPG